LRVQPRLDGSATGCRQSLPLDDLHILARPQSQLPGGDRPREREVDGGDLVAGRQPCRTCTHAAGRPCGRITRQGPRGRCRVGRRRGGRGRRSSGEPGSVRYQQVVAQRRVLRRLHDVPERSRVPSGRQGGSRWRCGSSRPHSCPTHPGSSGAAWGPAGACNTVGSTTTRARSAGARRVMAGWGRSDDNPFGVLRRWRDDRG